MSIAKTFETPSQRASRMISPPSPRSAAAIRRRGRPATGTSDTPTTTLTIDVQMPRTTSAVTRSSRSVSTRSAARTVVSPALSAQRSSSRPKCRVAWSKAVMVPLIAVAATPSKVRSRRPVSSGRGKKDVDGMSTAITLPTRTTRKRDAEPEPDEAIGTCACQFSIGWPDVRDPIDGGVGQPEVGQRADNIATAPEHGKDPEIGRSEGPRDQDARDEPKSEAGQVAGRDGRPLATDHIEPRSNPRDQPTSAMSEPLVLPSIAGRSLRAPGRVKMALGQRARRVAVLAALF